MGWGLGGYLHFRGSLGKFEMYVCFVMMGGEDMKIGSNVRLYSLNSADVLDAIAWLSICLSRILLTNRRKVCKCLESDPVFWIFFHVDPKRSNEIGD